MFDSVSVSNKVAFNTPATWIIQKSHVKSFFVRMHQESKLAEKVFGDDGTYDYQKIVVLQVLLTHESWFLVEMMYKSDFDENKEPK